MSLKEYGVTLFNGLTLVLADDTQSNNPLELARLFKDTGADIFNATPSRLLNYMELPDFCEALKHCKVIMSGGEAYSDKLLTRLHDLTKARIFNTYGPTEITVSSNCKELTHANSISIGAPLLNYTEFVVDSDGNELPVGVVGELYIGGTGVALGYNNLPEQTSERFVEYKGIRCYRSGDYARWTPEGDIVTLGRMDGQIKLRGLRIELGEVEAAISKVEGIKQVVVKVCNIQGKEHLSAYFVAEKQINIQELKEEIGNTLTHYMVPTAYMQLPAFPLTPNGKTDLKHLPEPMVEVSGEYVAPANETEKQFCDIFAQILELDKVGATDDFFELGGTSLVVTRILIEADKLGYKIAYGDVFANATPRKLSKLVGASEEDADMTESTVENYDYTAINQLLKMNCLDTFLAGKQQVLKNVLLTGSTGYLGIHILHELIQSSAEKIYCMVRGKDDKAAEDRLKAMLFYYFDNPYSELFGNRLFVVRGDVTQDIYAIDERLKDTTQVFNCAARVKHFSEGTDIEDVNIGGVEQCIKFCKKTGATLIHVSTMSTGGMGLNGKKLKPYSEDILYQHQYLGNQYTYSKFMGERLILEAVAKGELKGKIMRVGNLAAREVDGEFQANFSANSFMGRLRVYQMLGVFPYNAYDSKVEFSPIDQVAQAIVLLSTTPKQCTVFNPFNCHQIMLGDVVAQMKTIGSEVKLVEADEFEHAMKEAGTDEVKAQRLVSLMAYMNMAHGK